jgi:hypothetical protein
MEVALSNILPLVGKYQPIIKLSENLVIFGTI